jgi:uncharacterized membrane protein
MSEHQPMRGEHRPQNTTAATVSLVCGILSWVLCASLLLSVPAVIAGHMALGGIRRGDCPDSSRGMAIAGLVLGYVNIVLTVLGILFYVLIIALAVVGSAMS